MVQSGPGLVYITYPEVVLRLPGGPIWAVTFFVMLVTIGIDSEFCIVESLVTGIVDMWPDYLRYYQVWSLTQCCSVDFLQPRIVYSVFLQTRNQHGVHQLFLTGTSARGH